MCQSLKFSLLIVLVFVVGHFGATGRSFEMLKGKTLAIGPKSVPSNGVVTGETLKVKRDIFDDIFYALFDSDDNDDDDDDDKYLICRNCTVIVSTLTASQVPAPGTTVSMAGPAESGTGNIAGSAGLPGAGNVGSAAAEKEPAAGAGNAAAAPNEAADAAEMGPAAGASSTTNAE